MSEVEKRIADNLAGIQGRIAEAAGRSQRDPAEVRLVAVTKYVGDDIARMLVASGCHDLGESRPQEFWRKAESLADLQVRWHFIGHLQRNKVRRTLPRVTLVHSGDSLRLLREIDASSAVSGTIMPVLLEVNISGDANKHGFDADELEGLLPDVAALEHVRVQGLMAMAGLSGGLDSARSDFMRLRLLRDQLRQTAPEPISLDELSMGMSRDFEVAVEEGATMVRVGSALFDGVNE